MQSSSLQKACLALSVLAVVAGGLGMPVSFSYLASRHDQDVLAGVAGFIAGAILVGSGLVSLALLATAGRGARAGSPDPDRPLALPPDDDWRMKTGR